jgi:hypothetical protein
MEEQITRHRMELHVMEGGTTGHGRGLHVITKAYQEVNCSPVSLSRNSSTHPRAAIHTMTDVSSPSPLLSISPSCVPVIDPDEEVFDLYSTLGPRFGQSTTTTPAIPTPGVRAKRDRKRIKDDIKDTGGLGYLNISKDVIDIEIEINDERFETPMLSEISPPSQPPPPPTLPHSSHQSRRNKHGGTKVPPNHRSKMVFEASIAQDLGALRNRKGDTGEFSPICPG